MRRWTHPAAPTATSVVRDLGVTRRELCGAPNEHDPPGGARRPSRTFGVYSKSAFPSRAASQPRNGMRAVRVSGGALGVLGALFARCRTEPRGARGRHVGWTRGPHVGRRPGCHLGPHSSWFGGARRARRDNLGQSLVAPVIECPTACRLHRLRRRVAGRVRFRPRRGACRRDWRGTDAGPSGPVPSGGLHNRSVAARPPRATALAQQGPARAPHLINPAWTHFCVPVQFSRR